MGWSGQRSATPRRRRPTRRGARRTTRHGGSRRTGHGTSPAAAQSSPSGHADRTHWTLRIGVPAPRRRHAGRARATTVSRPAAGPEQPTHARRADLPDAKGPQGLQQSASSKLSAGPSTWSTTARHRPHPARVTSGRAPYARRSARHRTDPRPRPRVASPPPVAPAESPEQPTDQRRPPETRPGPGRTRQTAGRQRTTWRKGERGGRRNRQRPAHGTAVCRLRPNSPSTHHRHADHHDPHRTPANPAPAAPTQTSLAPPAPRQPTGRLPPRCPRPPGAPT